MSKRLVVLVAGAEAGELVQSDGGALSFRYVAGYDGVPLSTGMPISNRVYDDKRVRPFLFGLLPDDAAVRRDLGARYGVSGNNPFDLLEQVGLDCPGAVQICPERALDDVRARQDLLEPIDDAGIAARLARERERSDAAWTIDQERWSLGGQQSKFALRRKDGAWWCCLGSAATTHIFKGGVARLDSQAFNEFLCMRLARACGLPAARVDYETFAGEPALVVERYDRLVRPSGEVVRLHQEDFCQALGVLPENKYPEYGGPSARDVVALLKTTGENAAANIELFTSMLFFNYLIGATDAHAKNFSLLLAARSDAVLAPLYDVASIFPYVAPREQVRCAMSIGGENRIGRVGEGALRRYAEANGLADFGLDGDACIELMASLARRIPAQLAELLDEFADIPEVRRIGALLAQGVDRVGSAVLANGGTD